jgi:hypothetical protein
MVNFFEFFAIVPEIPSPKHHEIHEFGRNCHTSAMKFSNFTHCTALLQVHYNISFEVMSMIISSWSKAVLVLKNKHFVDFHSRNMVIFS